MHTLKRGGRNDGFISKLQSLVHVIVTISEDKDISVPFMYQNVLGLKPHLTFTPGVKEKEVYYVTQLEVQERWGAMCSGQTARPPTSEQLSPGVSKPDSLPCGHLAECSLVVSPK